ncbi:MAG: ATP-binding protein [Anaerolineaceae bacterium]|nr:ATP-binding protein [Anaerolineaceae bacterium]
MPDLNCLFLPAELARLQVLLQRCVLGWQRAGQDPADPYRGLYIADTTAQHLAQRPPLTTWGQSAALSAEEEAAFAAASEQAAAASSQIAAQMQASGETPRLDALAALFGLNAFERDVYLLALAPELDRAFEQIYGYLQDDVTRKQATLNLALNVLVHGDSERLAALASLNPANPLFAFHLLRFNSDAAPLPRQNRPLRVDETVLAWLLDGSYAPNAPLDDLARLLPATEPDNSDLRPRLESALAAQAVLCLHGLDETARRGAALQAAVLANRPLLSIHLTSAVDRPLLPLVRRALRDARLLQAMVCFEGWETCLEGQSPPPDLLAEVCDHPGPVILSARREWRAARTPRQRRLAWLAFDNPDYTRRVELWQEALGRPEREVAFLAGSFKLSSGQIRDAVQAAADAAGLENRPVQDEDLFAAARAQSNPSLSMLAQAITPRYTWNDLILPDDPLAQLREIVTAVRSRAQVLEGWGLGRKLASSLGVTVLFAGPPGTGKTMAAQIIAGELGLSLYRIDLSSVVSKYIGETEKNLAEVFSQAEASNAILFFDEADALFGKRSEVRDSHDRYANVEISYLLQRMEAYDGVTILATNLRANLDEAFTRRLQYAVDFPFPEEADRLRIWRTLFPPEVPALPNLDFDLLAKRFKLAGGNIRNIILNAAYLAAAEDQPLEMRHLLHSTRRELQKMGRLLGENDFQIETTQPKA